MWRLLLEPRVTGKHDSFVDGAVTVCAKFLTASAVLLRSAARLYACVHCSWLHSCSFGVEIRPCVESLLNCVAVIKGWQCLCWFLSFLCFLRFWLLTICFWLLHSEIILPCFYILAIAKVVCVTACTVVNENILHTWSYQLKRNNPPNCLVTSWWTAVREHQSS